MANRVAVFEHRRHGDHAHGDDRRCYGTGDRAENGADENYCVRETAAYRSKELTEWIEQVFRETATFENGAHKGEKRNSQQQVVGDDTEQLIGQVAEKVGADQAEFDAQEPKEQAGRSKRERRRISDEHEENHARKHQGREVFRDPTHCSGFSYLNSTSMTCSSAATRLMISETP